MIRLNKYLSEAGICSRREADRLIEAGRVTVDGVQAVPGMKVSKEQKICVGKKVIQGAEQKVVLAVNKPAGIVCTGDMKVKNNIIRFLHYPVRVTYAGRLDKDSEGLLIIMKRNIMSAWIKKLLQNLCGRCQRVCIYRTWKRI